MLRGEIDLGGSWTPLGTLGRLGGALEASWGILELSWRRLEAS